MGGVDASNEKEVGLWGSKLNLPEDIVDDWESAFEIFNDSIDPAARPTQ